MSVWVRNLVWCVGRVAGDYPVLNEYRSVLLRDIGLV